MASTRFLFETSFDSDAPKAPVAPPECAPEPQEEEPVVPAEPTFSEAELATARAEGEAMGRAAALEEAKTSAERAASEGLARIEQQLETLLLAWQAAADDRDAQCLRLTLAIVRKIFPRLAAGHAISEIEKVIGEALERLQEEPRIVVRVADSLLDSLQTRLETLTRRSGFEGKVVLISDEGLASGAVRVEWADGGAERDPESCWDAIEDLLEKAMPAPDGAQQPTPLANPEGPPPQPAEGLAAQA